MPWQQQGNPRRGSDQYALRHCSAHERDGRDIGIRGESPTHGDHIADQGGLLQCRVKEREADARVHHKIQDDLARSLPPALRSTVLMLVFGRSGNHADSVILLESFFQFVGKQRHQHAIPSHHAM